MKHLGPALIQAALFGGMGAVVMHLGHDTALWIDTSLVAFLVRFGMAWQQ